MTAGEETTVDDCPIESPGPWDEQLTALGVVDLDVLGLKGVERLDGGHDREPCGDHQVDTDRQPPHHAP
jgi:hypothetical protein